MIKALARLIVALNANARPAEIAAGAAFGVLLALVPGGNLLWYAIFAIAFLVKMNLAAMLLLLGLLRLVVPFADPALDALGYAVLGLPALRTAPAHSTLRRTGVLASQRPASCLDGRRQDILAPSDLRKDGAKTWGRPCAKRRPCCS